MINKVYYLKYLEFLLHSNMLRHDDRFIFCVVSVGDTDYIVGYTDSNCVIVLDSNFYEICDTCLSLNIIFDIPKFKSIPANEIHFINNAMLNDSYFFVKDKGYFRWVDYKSLLVFIENVYHDFKNGNKNIIQSVYDLDFDRVDKILKSFTDVKKLEVIARFIDFVDAVPNDRVDELLNIIKNFMEA